MAEPTIDSSSTFHCFPQLPVELRLPIWELARDALPGRVIELIEELVTFDGFEGRWLNDMDAERFVISRSGEEGCRSTPEQTFFTVRDSSVSLLSVSRESRHCTLNNYYNLFRDGVNGSVPSVPFDFDKDVLYLRAASHCTSHFLVNEPKLLAGNVKFLASIFVMPSLMDTLCLQNVGELGSVETIFILMEAAWEGDLAIYKQYWTDLLPQYHLSPIKDSDGLASLIRDPDWKIDHQKCWRSEDTSESCKRATSR
ncbi:uncharacterized protein LY89DRAFT_741623 [Mollisia scopiformis]|uniref:2EXR domain-containing protein n=1 Tax=Mollisia scopiformis TaxID=149040 RepID=A0A132B8R2_MOLSC|nr:uncharacterized protein LY89DRAFT_741623 [Mollisia scopiformis]KUJ08786.1 hypothetical protein LY89DRAFT_741623 [Mollisia scopiformis]